MSVLGTNDSRGREWSTSGTVLWADSPRGCIKWICWEHNPFRHITSANPVQIVQHNIGNCALGKRSPKETTTATTKKHWCLYYLKTKNCNNAKGLKVTFNLLSHFEVFLVEYFKLLSTLIYYCGPVVLAHADICFRCDFLGLSPFKKIILTESNLRTALKRWPGARGYNDGRIQCEVFSRDFLEVYLRFY